MRLAQWTYISKSRPAHLDLDRKFNSKAGLFSSTFWFERSFCCPWALLVFRPYCSKNASKTTKNMRFLKIGLNSTQKCKTHKTNVFYTILGGCWHQKVVSVFLFRHPKCHFFPRENGHFCRKCPFLHGEKWHFGCRNKKTETTFWRQHPPKMV